jgi:ABC-type uncharacterized transport system YnjBCD permease subunit
MCRHAAPSVSSEEVGSSFPMSSGMLLATCGKPLVAFMPLVTVWCVSVQSCMGDVLPAPMAGSDAACPAAIASSVVAPAANAAAIAGCAR